MSKRALILWVCIGALLLSAARMMTGFQSGADASSLSLVNLPSDGDKTAKAVDAPAKSKLLRETYGPSQPPVEHPSIDTDSVKESTLWLARVIYSETKLPHEQELVAWVVRNRVETGYRGRTTYKDVILDPFQFSAFNPDASKRSFFSRLTPDVQIPTWQQALWIAQYVRHADPAYRPFSIQTRHFFSERSMRNRHHPYWVKRRHSVTPGWNYQVNERRFRFYEEIS